MFQVRNFKMRNAPGTKRNSPAVYIIVIHLLDVVNNCGICSKLIGFLNIEQEITKISAQKGATFKTKS